MEKYERTFILVAVLAIIEIWLAWITYLFLYRILSAEMQTAYGASMIATIAVTAFLGILLAVVQSETP